MLLLLTLLMLALFLGIGAMLLTIAARARATARAYAAAGNDSLVNDSIVRLALDEALMAALRGSSTGTNGSVLSGTSVENILADKYGDSFTTTGSGLTPATNSVLTLSLASLPSKASPASRLNGRILTINPDAKDGDVASFRILAAVPAGSGATCYLTNVPNPFPRRTPTASGTYPVVVNDREFTPVSGTTTPEPYDAPDANNLWLAWPSLENGQLSGTFNKLSFCAGGVTATVDNDNDGIPDGVWIPSALVSGTVIPDRPSPLGGTLRFEVSYLILDLDGRINLNAAGMANRELASYGSAAVPLGMGYGPADVDPSLLFSGTSRRPVMPTTSGTSDFTGSGTATQQGVWPTLLLTGTPTTPPVLPSLEQRRRPPVLGRLFGRTGSNAVPGVVGDDVLAYQTTTQTAYPLTIAGTNAYADLKARAKVSMVATTGTVTPTLTFNVPTWNGMNNDPIDDPYEVRLDSDAPRLGVPRRPAPSTGRNDDSPFTLGELERILRQHDSDAPQLPERLAAGLEDAAQRARAMITTDSWDTPALVGPAARQIEDFIAIPSLSGTLTYSGSAAWLSGTTARNTMAAEVAAGLRFNINRPVTSGTSTQALSEQHEFCKDLYTLVMALSGTSGAVTPAQAAQWTANVLDFRDADSRMTGFEYDTNLSNGWSVDGLLTTTSTTAEPERAVVWGAERPDLLVTETGAFSETAGSTRTLLVTLHNPARNAQVVGTGTTTIEQLDSSLGTGGINLAKVVTGSSGTSAVWQIRLPQNGADTAVAFGIAATPTTVTQFVLNSSTSTNIVGNPAAVVQINPNGYLCVRSPSPTPFTTNAIPVHPVTNGPFEPPSSGTVILERLADPSRPNAIDNPYVAVDRATLSLVNGSLPWPPPPAPGPLKNRRKTPAELTPPAEMALAGFWQQSWSTGTTPLGLYDSGTTPVSWFHWPNRPFVSHGELALVATGNDPTRGGSDQLLSNYRFPIQSLATSGSSVPYGIITSSTSGTTSLGQLILDATYVPTRFAGNAVVVSGSTVAQFGFSEPSHNIFPKWREPGRVNANTTIIGTGSADNVIWAALVADASLANPFVSPPAPATSIGQLLSLTTTPNASLAMPSRPATDPRGLNPFLAAATAIRLANTATIRSHVFAVWITVRITDDSPDAPLPVTKRLFAIVDRSIPVGYSPGLDLNVRDTITLKRYLD
jgi:hypothetical protein